MPETNREKHSLIAGLNKAARPYLTLLFATAFMGVCVASWVIGELPIESFMTAIGPIVSTLVGFWFGERAALKRPGERKGKSEGEGG